MNDKSSECIEVRDYAWGKTCISMLDAGKLYHRIRTAAIQGKDVVLDFSDVDEAPTYFLNVAIGKLYDVFDAEVIKQRMTVINCNNDIRCNIKRVTDNAKEFYKGG